MIKPKTSDEMARILALELLDSWREGLPLPESIAEKAVLFWDLFQKEFDLDPPSSRPVPKRTRLVLVKDT